MSNSKKLLQVLFAAVLLMTYFPMQAQSATSDQITFFNLYNDLYKKAGGTHDLVMSEQLNQAATNHSKYMNLNNAFSHTETPGLSGFTGIRPEDRLKYAGYNGLYSGENIASTSDINYAIDVWMLSLGHRATMLDRTIKDVGFGNTKTVPQNSVLDLGYELRDPEKNLMKYPYSNQVGVPISDNQNHGYPITIFSGMNTNMETITYSFKNSAGSSVEVMNPDPSGSYPPYVMRAKSPLKYNERYTVNVSGNWLDGSNTPFSFTWSFTTEAKDFSLSVNSNTIAIGAGEKATYGITVNPINNPSYPVNLLVTGLPAGVTASFSQNNLIPYFDSNLYIQTTSSLASGTYPLTLKGTGGGITHTIPLSLIIKEKPTLSASANPATITYPAATTLSGELKRKDGKILVGKSISIQSLGTDRRWHAVTTVKTDALGKWAFNVNPSRIVQYRALFRGDSSYSPVTSAAVTVNVKCRVGISARYYRIRRNRSDLLRFSVSPRHARKRIGIQKKYGTSWRTIKWITLSSYSYGRWYFKTSQTGNHYFRAVFPVDSDHARSYSKEIRIRVVR